MNVPDNPAATAVLDARSVDAILARVAPPRTAKQYVALGHEFSQRHQFTEAAVCLHKAIELDPDAAMAFNNLGWVRQMQGETENAVGHYKKALQLDPTLRLARRNLALLLVQLGRRDEAIELFHAELLTDEEGVSWLTGVATAAMEAQDLTLAGEYAAILAGLRWASPWYPPRQAGMSLPLPVQAPEVFLTIPKLRHDIEQFEYLQQHGVLDDEFTPIIKTYESLIERLEQSGAKTQVPLDLEVQQSIGHVYNRIVHIRHTPRVQQVFSDSWDPAEIEGQFLNKPLGLVVVDDFLSAEALESVRLFCLESTVWSANRYANGRFGAFFHNGFNCPLLLQISEELRKVLPRVIIDRYPLRQLWGFKNGQHLPAGSTVHADFAAVNVNFWITSTEANLEEDSGGLVVYDVDAPLTWDFATYNGDQETIKRFLKEQNAHAVHIPYRENRAIIFNSDLFHASAGLHFRPGYENRRINITMLYGERESDVHHRNIVGASQETDGGSVSRTPGWRSAAFSRFRQSR